MKKINIFLTLSFALLSFTFLSCQDEVFYGITQDVAPETATVSGAVTSIVRYNMGSTEYLVLNGDYGVRYKDASTEAHICWGVYGALPAPIHYYDYINSAHVGQQYIKILADADYLYLISVEYLNNVSSGTTNPYKVHLYAQKLTDWGSGNWTDLTSSRDYLSLSISSSYYTSNFTAFCTNAPQVSHRKAYFRSGSTLYELNGTGDPTAITVTNKDVSGNTNSCAWYGTGVIFFNSAVNTTNETKSSNPTVVYYADNLLLRYSTDGTNFTTATTAGQVISTLACCSDALIIGKGNFTSLASYFSSSSYGVSKVALDGNGIPTSYLVPFSTNIESIISSGYMVYTFLNTDPSRSELTSTLYASIGFLGTGSSTGVSYDDIGLWSYYPYRANWNRE